MTSFDQGLRDVLREDPDVIVVGELRESETVRLTLNAVESGHLVIASLHATNSEDALYRMCNSFPSDAQDMVRTQLSSVLSLLVIQKLEYMPQYGFRVPILSILKCSLSLKATIRDNRFSQIESILQTGRSEGMFTMEKYRSEYIKPRSKLTSPSVSLKPSPEAAEARIYRSSLLDDDGNENPGQGGASNSSRRSTAGKRTMDAADTVYVLGEGQGQGQQGHGQGIGQGQGVEEDQDSPAFSTIKKAAPSHRSSTGFDPEARYVIEDTGSITDIISELSRKKKDPL
jgi:hypothetical protein